MSGPIEVDFKHIPTCYQAFASDAFVIGLRGPVGSAKSSSCAVKLMAGAMSQAPGRGNIRRSRWAIIRNTAPELKSTTIQTFLAWFPVSPVSKIVYSSPILYTLSVPPRDGQPGVEAEFYFIALDTPKDVRKLLSLELTGAWVNEAREIAWAVIDRLTERVGRYPSMEDGGASWAGIVMDTNSPDEDSWWYRAFEVEPPIREVMLHDGTTVNVRWEQFVQPPAVLEASESGACIEPGYTSLVFRKEELIPAAGRFWAVNPKAENLPNLRPGYYHQQVANKTLESIQCYQQNKYVFVAEGKPVIPEYVPSVMGGDWPILKDEPLILGIDAGGGTLAPAATVWQRHPRGNWMAQGELCAEDMGMERFVDALSNYLAITFPGMRVEAAWMDPAGEKRDEIYETKVMDYFKAAGFPVRAAPTQDIKARIDAIRRPCGRMIDGKPGLMVNKHRCPRLHKALSGSWYYRRLQVPGADRYEEKPCKNEFSHPADSAGYALSGGGEGRILKTTARREGTTQAKVAFDVFGR